MHTEMFLRHLLGSLERCRSACNYEEHQPDVSSLKLA